MERAESFVILVLVLRDTAAMRRTRSSQRLDSRYTWLQPNKNSHLPEVKKEEIKKEKEKEKEKREEKRREKRSKERRERKVN
jgi:hypothetical protein